LFLDFVPRFKQNAGVISPNALMNGKPSNSGKQGSGQTGSGSAKGALLLGVLGVGGIIVAIAIFNSGSPPKTQTDPSGTKPGQHDLVTTPTDGSGDPKGTPYGATKPSDGLKPSPSPKTVVDSIVSIATLTNEVTHEQAEKFKEGLTELVRQGPASVPAIQDYLDKNVDSNYGNVKGAEELGYNSLRHALIDTMKQIGGPEAEGSMVHVLQTTAEPNEVGELGRDLEQMAPGQHQAEVLQAAKEALDMAHNGQLGANIERGPLYRLFQMYNASYAPPGGDANAAPQEQQDGPGEHPVNAAGQ
jgi:hypothetical protein